MPEPFNNNITYIPPEVLDSSVKVKHSDSHYAKGRILLIVILSHHKAITVYHYLNYQLELMIMTYDKLETAESNYATPNYTVYY